MQKKWLRMGVVTVLGVFLVVPASWALDKGPEKIDINAQKTHSDVITKKDKKSVLGFTHQKHADEYLKGNAEYAKYKYTDDYTCAGCHHTSKAGEQPGSCLKCKDIDKKLKKVGGAKKFEKIYHKNCKTCHKKMDKAGKKTGPTKCAGCHPKKKK